MKIVSFAKGYKQVWVPGSRGRKGYFRTMRGAKEETAAKTTRSGDGTTRSRQSTSLKLTGTQPHAPINLDGVVSHTWGPPGGAGGTSVGLDRATQLYGEVKRERGGSPVSDKYGVEIANGFLRASDSWEQAKEKLMDELNNREMVPMRKSMFGGENIGDYILDEKDGVLEKAKRVWVPPSGGRKGYYRSDPRGKSRRQKKNEAAKKTDPKKAIARLKELTAHMKGPKTVRTGPGPDDWRYAD